MAKILAVAAHPDDLDFGCAGSTATWVAAGDEVVYCIVTDGQAGGSDRNMPRDEMARIRRAEQTAAAERVGVTEIHWLGFADGAVEANLALREAISRVIRVVRPDRVVTQQPTRNLDRIYGSHPDHTATGEAALCAVYPDARNPFAFPSLLDDEGLEPHAVPEVWLVGGPDADTFVDITDAFDAKIEALVSHESQISDPERIRTLMHDWGKGMAATAGFDDGRLAEGFRKLDTA